MDEGWLRRWQAIGEAALAVIDGGDVARTGSPSQVDVIVVDDAAIAKLHGEFLQDPTPTDVMTFPTDEGGEIVISIETAERQAAEFGNSIGREACLYIVHGLLHLCGYEDQSTEGSAEMDIRQEALLEKAERRAAGDSGTRDSSD